MTKFAGKYRIESNRWQYWDYSNPGRYFITICIENRESILGNIENKKMILSEYGIIVKDEILKMPQYNQRVIMDEWIIMPNHIHLLIELGDYAYNNGATVGNVGGITNDGTTTHDDGIMHDGAITHNVDKIHEFYLQPGQPEQSGQSGQSEQRQRPHPIAPWWNNPNYKPTIDEIKQYRKQRRRMIIPMVVGKMQMITSKQINILRNTPGQKNWQHDYNDHVIRNNKSYILIKNYIINNPENWEEDKFFVDI